MLEIQSTCRAMSQQQKSPGLGELRTRSRALRPAPLRRGEAYSPDNRGRNDQNESRL